MFQSCCRCPSWVFSSNISIFEKSKSIARFESSTRRQCQSNLQQRFGKPIPCHEDSHQRCSRTDRRPCRVTTAHLTEVLRILHHGPRSYLYTHQTYKAGTKVFIDDFTLLTSLGLRPSCHRRNEIGQLAVEHGKKREKREGGSTLQDNMNSQLSLVFLCSAAFGKSDIAAFHLERTESFTAVYDKDGTTLGLVHGIAATCLR